MDIEYNLDCEFCNSVMNREVKVAALYLDKMVDKGDRIEVLSFIISTIGLNETLIQEMGTIVAAVDFPHGVSSRKRQCMLVIWVLRLLTTKLEESGLSRAMLCKALNRRLRDFIKEKIDL